MKILKYLGFAVGLALMALGISYAVDQRIQYNEAMTGANHPTLSDSLNRLTLVEHNTDGTHKNGLILNTPIINTPTISGATINTSTINTPIINTPTGDLVRTSSGAGKRVEVGTGTILNVPGLTNGGVDVAFSAPFSETPKVFIIPLSATPSLYGLCTVANVTSSTFSGYIYNGLNATQTLNFYWIAIGG